MIVDTDWGDGLPVYSIFAWKGSSWVESTRSGAGGFDVPDMALSLTSARFMVLISGTSDRDGYHRLLFTEVRPDSILPPDTVMTTPPQSTERAGAVSERRRWAIRSQQRVVTPPFDTRYWIRVAYSDTIGIWHEMPQLGINEDHCAVAPLGDYSAIVVYAGQTGLASCIAEGDRWVRHEILDARPWRPAHPRFRFRPSGGLWLMWTDREWVHVSQYSDGQWIRGDSLKAIHQEGETFGPGWCDMSRDGAERPVLAWGDLGFGYTYRDVGIVAFPTESGWTPGEEIPGSEAMFLTPRVARDRNGDAWIAWRVRGGVLSRWTHTYVSATTSTPVVSGAGRERVVSWTLSESAPESWWAVLRARNEGPFEEIARIEAGSELEMSWVDRSPPAGVLRYRIRRESVDSRYRWESAEARWPAKPIFALKRLGEDRMELSGAAAGPLEVHIYDIQGRLVHQHKVRATGTGQDTIQLELAGMREKLTAGIYFAFVRDSGGQVAAPLKFVILR